MSEFESLAEWIKLVGSGGLIFLVWYFYHKSVTGQFDTILQNQAQRESETFRQMNEIIHNQAETAKQNFELLKDMVSTNLLQNEKLERIETKIEDHHWCPFFKKILNDEKIGKELQ